MNIIHEPFVLKSFLLEIDNILAYTGDKVSKFNYIPSIEEIADKKLLIAVCSVVYLRVRPKLDNSLASIGQVVMGNRPQVTFRQRVIAQQTFINVMREHSKCFDFMFLGDEMVCVLDTTFQNDINELLEQLAKLNSMLNIVSKKSQLAGLSALEWGIGAHYGEVFVAVQRHHASNIQFNWSGQAFQTSYGLSMKAIDDAPNTIYVSGVFNNNLKDKYKELLNKRDDGIYSANIINRHIKDWQTENLDNDK